MSDITDQWLRKCSLAVAPEKGGEGLDFTELRVRFSVRRADIQTPNTLEARVWNVSEETANKVQKEFTRVVLQAGYEYGNYGILFDGNVKQIRWGRENQTDTYMDILAADGDEAYNFAVVNTTLAAGSQPTDHAWAAQAAMAEHGIKKGFMPTADEPKLPRGKVMFGMSRDYLRDASAATNCSWSIQDGYLQLVPLTGYLPGEAVVLTAKTGMVGMPEQTQDGIRVKCLLNPMIKVGGRVQIDNKSVQRMRIDMSYTAINFFPKVADDGFYRVLVAEHHGDTRSTEWYSDLICLALDDTVPPSLAVKGIV